MQGRTLAVFGIPAILCAAWTVFAGKDLNWDLLHYHYYSADSLIHGRFAQDYFAARTESYFNPLGYVPFYLLVAAGWHSVLVSMLLAMVHSTAIGLLYLLCRQLFVDLPRRRRILLSALGAALGSASAVFFATAGTSFLDPTLVVPMLGGVVLLLNARPGDAIARSAVSGVLFGLAAALKYSNVFFAVAALVLVVSVRTSGWAERARAVAAYAVGGASAVALFAGPWLARLGREFGNPFFPHLNAIFGSPDAPAVMLSAGRFAPHGLLDVLAFPLRMASPNSMTYAEISAPDLRFGALALAGTALGLSATAAWLRRGTLAGPSKRTEQWEDPIRLIVFFLLCLAAWVWSSANGRYGLLVLLLVGPCLAYLVARLAPRYAYLILALLLGAQIAACVSISPTRWFVAERWSKSWLPFQVPARAQRESALYLTVEPQAMTAAIPFLHPASSFANLQAQDSAAPGWKRLAALRERHADRVRVLGRGLRLQTDGKPRADVVESYDWTLLRFGYRVDTSDCFSIGWRLDDEDFLSRWANHISATDESRERNMSLASCALAAGQRDPAEVEEEQRMSALFNRIERACAGLFGGLTAVTERRGAEWSRSYPSLEARIETQSGRIVMVLWFKLRYFDLGTLQDWAVDAFRPPACRT